MGVTNVLVTETNLICPKKRVIIVITLDTFLDLSASAGSCAYSIQCFNTVRKAPLKGTIVEDILGTYVNIVSLERSVSFSVSVISDDFYIT